MTTATTSGPEPPEGAPDLSALLRHHRQRQWLTQEQLAERTGLSARTIRRLETGALPRPRRRTVELLADALELGADDRDVLILASHGPDDPVPIGEPAPETGPGPAQLPTDVPTFTGRDDQLRRLDALLPDRAGTPSSAVVIAAIEGTAGIGKSSLAIHWAHRVADRFPDGQLYVNLRGFDPSDSPLTPDEALQGLLDGLGVSARRIPAGLAERSALYRSALAGRRFLVLLDNARDTVQVRPLLPGSPGCLVLVTSRNQLTGLIASEGAHPLPLDLLDEGEAYELLCRRLGRQRVEADPASAADILGRCAGLPLTLAIVTARAAARPDFPLAAIAAELREAGDSLDAFASGDAMTDVRAALSWSYSALTAPAARMFRLLGLHPGPDVAVPAAASLAGVSARDARRLLTELAGAHLVDEWSPGRYRQHDVLRAYARELVQAAGGDTDRHRATSRMLDHYLQTAVAADRVLQPVRDAIAVIPALAGVSPAAVETSEAATAWFAAEHRVLLAVVRHAAGAGFDRHAWQLAWTLWGYLDSTGQWHDWAETQQLALAAATRAGDRQGAANAHRGLGRAYTRLARYDEAEAHLGSALAAFRELGDLAGVAHTHNNLALMHDLQGNDRSALAEAERALAVYRESGHRAGEADGCNNVGWFLIRLGEPERGLRYCQQSLALLREIGDLHGTAHALDSLASAYHRLARYAEADAHYRQAVALFAETDRHYLLADTLERMGDNAAAAGDPAGATEAWRRSAAILTDLGLPTETLQAKLA